MDLFDNPVGYRIELFGNLKFPNDSIGGNSLIGGSYETENAANSRSFERIILNLPQDPSLNIALLRDFASPPGTILRQRLDRRYKRLCFDQEELRALSEKKRASRPEPANGNAGAMNGIVFFEDFVFSNMDFSRYAKIHQAEFDFFLESVSDFDGGFFSANFNISPVEAKAVILKEYKKIDVYYCLAKPNPLILSIMRTLETSLESVPLVQEGEILNELNVLYDYLNAQRGYQDRAEKKQFPPEAASLFCKFLIKRLDGVCVIHHDGNETKLFINPQGGLSATFMPGGKPWTLKLSV